MNLLSKKFALTCSLAVALFVSFAGDAQAAKYKAAAKAKDGRSARSTIVKRYKKAGHSTNIRVTKTGMSKSGKSLQVAVESKGNGNVQLFNVRKGTSYATPTNALTQKEAQNIAHQKMRRQNGTYSGTHESGLSKSGKSYVFTSKTDRSKKTGDKAYVNVTTGKTRRSIKGE